MIRFFYILFLGILCFEAGAQTLSFETEEYDFGEIAELGGAVSYRFVYTNTGDKPLILNSVHTSCGCTSPSWSKEPVLSHQHGYVDVTFDPRNRQGGFTKSIIIKSNGGDKTLSGNVLPKPDPIAAEYPFKMFDLRLKTTTINFGRVNLNSVATQEIAVYNPSEANLKIETQSTDYLTVSAKPQILKPGQKGVIKCVFMPEKFDGFDFVKFAVPIFVNTYEYKLQFKAIVAEKFSEEIKAKPPKICFSDDVKLADLGSFTAGDTAYCALTFKNTGEAPLKIRSVRNACEWLKWSYKAPESGILPGERGSIDFNFLTDNLYGVYDRYVTIVTNSPETQYVVVHFRLNVVKKE